jgi:tetratricopeptide (TPR) repeat protein
MDDAAQDFEQQVEQIRARLERLEKSEKQHAPWWRNSANLISAVALFFSFGTTYVSHQRTVEQDVHALRAQLQSTLQRLVELPKENLAAYKQYANEPNLFIGLSSLLNQENLLLSKQAADLVRRLPADRVSATDYVAVGQALQNSRNFEMAEASFRKAVDTSSQLDDETAGLRHLANISFVNGRPQEGRALYERALRLFDKYRGYDEHTQAYINLLTELAWSSSEAASGFWAEADRRVSSAEKFLGKLPPGPAGQTFKTQLDQHKQALLTARGTGTPPAGSISPALPGGLGSPPPGTAPANLR